MSSRMDEPEFEDEPDDDDDFLREVARVEDVMPPARQPVPGQLFGRFRILSELGRGGMGIVYLAHDENLRRAVALKLLPPSLTRQDERYRRFLREARAAASVTHPNLATIYDVGEVEGNVFIAMERVEGRTLRKLLASGRPELDVIVDIAGQILAGLAKAHQAGIVHRDLKPDNIMVTDDGVIKLLDFGLAKQHDGTGKPALASSSGTQDKHDSAQRDTGADQLLGTPGYMSPEQVRGGPIDPRSDLFAFGVILYEMLAGKRPFTGQSAADLQSAILRDTPAPLASLRSDLPEALVRLVERCLEKDPARRYPSSGALSIALAQLAVGSGQLLTPSSATLRDAAASTGPRETRGAVRRLGERASAVGKVLAAALVVLLAGIYFKRPDGHTEATQERLAAAALATSAARVEPTPVTALPLPQSNSPEAVTEYALALQGIRDGNWGYASSHLERALELDPSLAIAHLRYAAIHSHKPYMRPRSHYAMAVAGRARLSERDQTFLQAYEPLLARDPADRLEHIARLRAAAERFPGDAELAGLVSWTQMDEPEEQLAYAKRAVELDPEFGDGWQMLGASLYALGKTEEAMRALDRCIALSPASADCSAQRALVHGSEGRCSEMDADLRRAVASSTNGMWQEDRAAALFALGAAPEAIVEVLRNKWPRPDPETRKVLELIDHGNLAIAIGHFAEAEQQTLSARALLTTPEAETHAGVATQLAEIYTETNRLKDAGRVSEDYLKRQQVWMRSLDADRQTIGMYWAMLRARTLSLEAFVERRDAWIKERRIDAKRSQVFASYASGVQTPEEAKEALAMFSDVTPPRVVADGDFAMPMFGKLYVLTGRSEEAVPYLRRTVDSCYALMWPFIHTRSNFYLGQALEAAGDTTGACSAYATVLARWGNARPESVTASRARARARNLHCPATAATVQSAR